MPRANPEELPVEQIEAYEGRITQLGPYNLAFEKMPANFPPHELFRGLPDDHCQCDHWGYVLKGAIKFSYTDGTEEVLRLLRRRLLRAPGPPADGPRGRRSGRVQPQGRVRPADGPDRAQPGRDAGRFVADASR